VLSDIAYHMTEGIMRQNKHFSLRTLPAKALSIFVAGAFSTAAVLTETAPAQAQNWRGIGGGFAAGLIGGAIIGGALSQQHGYARPVGPQASAPSGTTRKHSRRHKDSDEEQTTPASARSNEDRPADTKSSDGASLARGVYSTSSAGQQGASSSADDVGLVRSKAH
jgi:hypothetical protein